VRERHSLANLRRALRLEPEIRRLLGQIASFCHAKPTRATLEKIHRLRTELAEVCGAYESEFSDFQLDLDVSVHEDDRESVLRVAYAAHAVQTDLFAVDE
jgi:hypothetical protein